MHAQSFGLGGILLVQNPTDMASDPKPQALRSGFMSYFTLGMGLIKASTLEKNGSNITFIFQLMISTTTYKILGFILFFFGLLIIFVVTYL